MIHKTGNNRNKYLDLKVSTRFDSVGRAVERVKSAAAHLLGLLVRIPQGARMSVSCECCVFSGRDFATG